MKSTMDAAPATTRAVASTTSHEAGGKPTTAARRAGAARMKIRVLAAEDHPLVTEGLIPPLGRDPGMQVTGEADTGITAMKRAGELTPEVMVLALRIPGVGAAVG